MVALCELAQMTPQNYYARRSVRSRHEVDVGLLLALVKAQRKEQPRLGVRKLYHLIAPELRQGQAGAGPALCGVGPPGPAGGAEALGRA